MNTQAQFGRFGRHFGLLTLLCAGAQSALANDIALAWDAVADTRVALYEVHYGQGSGAYVASLDSATTEATITGLTPGETYFFAVRACDQARAECSEYSNEVSSRIPAPAPEAAFSVNVTSGEAPLTVLFESQSTGTIDAYTWEFGDGGNSNAPNAAYTFSQPGVYSVSLSVSGPDGSDTQTMTDLIEVVAPASPSSPTEPSDPTEPEDPTDPIGIAKSPLEFGEIEIDHQWVWVEYAGDYADPVVVAKPASANDRDPVLIRIEQTDATGFWIRLQEWDYLDDWHGSEIVSYLVVEKGQHQLPSGEWIEAGTLMADASGFPRTATAFAAPFAQVPVMLTAVASVNEADAVITQLTEIDTAGFKLTLTEQEANSHRKSPGYGHVPETVAYIAWEPSLGEIGGVRFEVGRSQASAITENPHTLAFEQVFDQAPAFFADLQTSLGGDPATLRWANRDLAQLDVWAEEESSKDAEIKTASETLGYLLIEAI